MGTSSHDFILFHFAKHFQDPTTAVNIQAVAISKETYEYLQGFSPPPPPQAQGECCA
jgi:hypothetical protein